MIDALIDIAGLKSEEIAFFTQKDGYDDIGFAVGVIALKRHDTGARKDSGGTHARSSRRRAARFHVPDQ
jgi:branched-chain amino acid transport system substrate-binding protein